MAHSIFGRGESIREVSKRELYLPWAMMHGVRVNTGHWLIQHLLHVSRHDSGAIAVGEIVSMIAIRLGIQLDSPVHTRVLGNDKLDLNTLVLMKMCRKEGGRYLIINEEGTYASRPTEAVHEKGGKQEIEDHTAKVV
ncbi:hypothetical protein ACLOJK_026879 [Asimina triloba]